MTIKFKNCATFKGRHGRSIFDKAINSNNIGFGFSRCHENKSRYYLFLEVCRSNFRIDNVKFFYSGKCCYNDSILFSHLSSLLKGKFLYELSDINCEDVENAVGEELMVGENCFHCSSRIAIDGAVSDVKKKMNIR